MKQRSFYVFETSHPVVPACYVIVTLCLTMAAMQPVLIAISFIGAFTANCSARGPRSTFAGLRWQLPIIAIIALFNPLFSASGSTVLFYLGARAVYLESLMYGLAMGGLFVASALWFMAGSHILTFDKVMALFGNVAPVVALMISSTMRMIPRFVRRGHQILSVQGAQGVLLVAVLCCVLAMVACSQFLFYPVLSRLVVWWGYVPYAAWMLFPAAMHAVRSRRFA